MAWGHHATEDELLADTTVGRETATTPANCLHYQRETQAQIHGEIRDHHSPYDTRHRVVHHGLLGHYHIRQQRWRRSTGGVPHQLSLSCKETAQAIRFREGGTVPSGSGVETTLGSPIETGYGRP